MQDYEKLGAFYLGKVFDTRRNAVVDDLLMYDAKDLTTHAVCVGMTGSGKTGLCMSLLEEAAIDGIPAIVIDPKGDLGNLLLAFPELQAADFQPWLEAAEAARKGLSMEELAAQTAETWRQGLASWHQSPERIARMQNAAEFSIYTPGSTAGRAVSVLRSFAAPPAETVADPTVFRDYLMSAVSGLLALVGISGDPLRSREHILLASILEHHWRLGQDLDIPAMIHEIQKPPFNKVGVFDLDSFYPANDRLSLAMALNSLIASPGFAVWTQGEPLDVQRLLYTPDGRPRISVLSIAHLSDGERMFFVTILLNAVLAWMRAQSGTASLRAILYMDEIFGYFPPTANPPSKPPMLTLLKQARAFGLGVVLATQNPVDLDYKGLANTGTWLIGRLQTDRDKARVLDGLESAAGGLGEGYSRAALDQLLSGLGNRVFLLHNVHRGQPVLFQTRWVLSYLRGPLTLNQIKALTKPALTAATTGESPPASDASFKGVSQTSAAPASAQPAATARRPTLPPGIAEFFLRPRHGGADQVEYRPAVLAQVRLHFVDAKTKTDCWQTIRFLHPGVDHADELRWGAASSLLSETAVGDREPLANAAYQDLPDALGNPANYTLWQKLLLSHVYQEITLDLHTCHDLKLASKPGETAGDFKARVGVVLRERRDLDIEKMRKKYSARLTSLQEQLRKADARVAKQKEMYGQQKLSTAISFGSTLLGAIFGKAASTGTVGRAASTMRGASRATAKKKDVELAADTVEALQERFEALQREMDAELAQIQHALDIDSVAFDTVGIRPRKSDIAITTFGLAWCPVEAEDSPGSSMSNRG